MKEVTTLSKRDLKKIWRQSRKAKDIKIWWAAIEGQDKTLVKQIIDESMIAEKRLETYKESPLFRFRIRKYVCQHGWTDVYPFEVVRVVSPKCVEIRALDTIQLTSPKEFYPGGFSGHYADNYNQTYEYVPNPANKIKRLHLGKHGWGLGKFTMREQPYKFHDYNF